MTMAPLPKATCSECGRENVSVVNGRVIAHLKPGRSLETSGSGCGFPPDPREDTWQFRENFRLNMLGSLKASGVRYQP